jgi:hypothetical protein
MRQTVTPRVVAHREIFNPDSVNLSGVDNNEIAHVRPIVDEVLRNAKGKIKVLGTDAPLQTILSVTGWQEHISMVDWCNKYHNPESNEYTNITDTKVVPQELVFYIKKRSAAAVPNETYVRPAAAKRAPKRIHVIDELDSSSDERDTRSYKPVTTEKKRRAYDPSK